MPANDTVCHITTVHPRRDIRVFHKECKSLAEAGYQVKLIVNDGLGKEQEGNVEFQDIGGHRNRLTRIVLAVPKAFVFALRTKARVYHFHDPELLPVGLILALLGKHVIYDVHEDVPRQILNKTWISPALRNVISKTCEFVEHRVSKIISACVCTTPLITNRYKAYGANAIMVRNYPTLAHVDIAESAEPKKEFLLCYAGSLVENRGIREVIEVAEKSETKIIIMGPCREPDLLEDLQGPKASKWVEYKGLLTKEEVEAQYRQCTVGMAALYPKINYIHSLPIKLFEYMMFGMPVICSNFDLWREIVEGNECGFCVDPADIDTMVAAVLRLKNNPDEVAAMAKNGHHAVINQYNWRSESQKLQSLYQSILN